MQVGPVVDVTITATWVVFVFVHSRYWLLRLGPKLFPPSPAPLAPPTPAADAATREYVDEHLRSVILGMREVPPTGFVMIRGLNAR